MGGTPSSFVVDDMGDIYTFYPSQDCVLKFDSNGELLADWFISDDDDTAGQFDGTYFRGIAVDDGYIYVGSYDKGCILKFIVEGKKEGFVVNTTGDESDADKGDGVCDVDLSEDGEQCTLRAAIEEVNLSKGNDTNTITFDIPTTDTGYSSTTGTATFTISPRKALPDIKKTVVIDAASQSNGMVELDGKDAGKANGLSVQREDATIKGMNIRNFSKDGLQAKSDVFLKNTKISSNKGSGVSSSADITIEATDNEFSDNGKSGIKSNGKVDAVNAVLQAENNGSYGIFANEDVTINGGGTNSIEYIPYGSQTSKISNNGKGGISAGSSRYSGHDDDYSGGCHLEVTDNGSSVEKDSGVKLGNGVYVRNADFYLSFSKVNKNHGYGIFTTGGDVRIFGTGNEFSDNGMSGIYANSGKVDAANAVLQAENNGSYGIFANEDVTINGGGTNSIEYIPYGSQTSKISNNGKGGISAGSSRNSGHDDDYSGGCHLEVTDNGSSVEKDSGVKLGNGVYVRNADFYLSFSKVNKNHGYGIFTTGGDVRIFGTGNEFSDNWMSGIYANSGKVDAANAVLQAENNGSYGIYAKGDVSINVTTQSEGGTETAYSMETSKISNNGKDGISAKKDTSGSGGGAVDAFNLEVTGNTGAGIRAESDLTLNGGNICGNAGGNLIVGGGKNLTDVTVCESVSTVETQGNTMLDMELSVEGSGCAENEELDSLNTTEEQDVAAITQEDEK